jgi:protoheme IX farnesyltransferase
MRRLMATIGSRLALYWKLIKSLQTGLLLVTGVAGYMSARCPVLNWSTLLALMGSLFLAIAGSTVLNMVYDRDIDSMMQRTCGRPLPSGQISPAEGAALGMGLFVTGVAWAYAMHPLYGSVVLAGGAIDVLIYTIWLKRRTPWSILWGGIAGGMPALAGRVLGVGGVDWIGVLLGMGVLLWIPTHIMTFSIRHLADYEKAGIPTFPSAYGVRITNRIIAVASVLSAGTLFAAAYGIGMAWGYLRLLAVLAGGLLVLAVLNIFKPNRRLEFGLFKYASVYLLSAMLIVVAATL